MTTNENSEEAQHYSQNLFLANNTKGKTTSSTTGNNFKTARQEFITFIIFLVITCTLSFGMVSQDMYYLNNAMAKLFLETPVSEMDNRNFKSISTISDFWKFAEGPLLEGLYWNNNAISSGGKSFVYHENLLLGVPQIRQLRVLPNKCNVHAYFKNTIKECFIPYDFNYEDTTEFGFKNSSEWRYYVPQYLEWHWGKMGTYSSGGYIATLDHTKDKSKFKIQYLQRNNWLTRGTRVVFIDFSLYNANINLFCVSRLIVEFPATGGAIPSSQFYAVKLLRYISDTDYFIASCEILFCLAICVFIFQDVMRLKKQHFQYFKYFWNWIDLLIIMISLLAVGLNLYRTVQVSLLLEDLLGDPNTFPNLHFLAYWQTQYNNVIALNVFFSWIKIFKFLSFNNTMGRLSTALFHCAKDIIGFAVMFFIIFFSYAQLAFLIFGDEVADFSSFANCVYTQFRIILGDFNFADIERADRIYGPLYFVTFVFFVFFILMNIFLAIINDTYSEVKSDFSLNNTEINIWDIIHQDYQNIFKYIQKKTEERSNIEQESEENDMSG